MDERGTNAPVATRVESRLRTFASVSRTRVWYSSARMRRRDAQRAHI